MSEFSDIILTIDENCAHLRFNQPLVHNALTFRTIAEIKAAIRQVRETPELTVLILSGEGPSFCSGDNLRGMGDVPYGGDWLKTVQHDWYQSVVEAIRSLPLPVVALGQGHILGAGLEILMASDIKIVTECASLGIPFARLGTAAMNYHLPRQIGFTRAARMLFTGDYIDGATAVQWGLATECVSDQAALDSCAVTWAEKFRGLSTRAIGEMKQTFYQAYETEERHWYTWWSAQWVNYMERREALGPAAMAPDPVPPASKI